MAYFDLVITRIPIGNIPDTHGDGCFPKPCKEDSEELKSCGFSPWLRITDNGKDGEGVYVSGHRRAGEHPEFIGFSIPSESIPLIVEALISILAMRKAQKQ